MTTILAGRQPSHGPSLNGSSVKEDDQLDIPTVSDLERLQGSSNGGASETEPRSRSLLPMRRFRAGIASWLPDWLLAVFSWIQGPTPPVSIQPRSFVLENACEKWLERGTRLFRSHWLLSALFLAAWLIMNAFLTRESWFSASTPAGAPTLLSTTSSFWTRNDGCGVDGETCEPFDNSILAFRCPASSDNVKLLNQRAVGPLEINFQKMVVGGGDVNHTYRADSWLCSAALQQGLISSTYGGCGVATQIGMYQDFESFDGHGISSVSFNTYFPSAYRLGASNGSHCKDLKFVILAVNVVMLFLFTILFRPRDLLFFWVAISIGFWQVALTTNGPPNLSAAFETFLPCLFFAYGLWRSAARFTLPAFNGLTLERAFVFGFFFWLGCLIDMTIESWLPLDRLTPEDINRQPGGLAAIIVIVLIVAVCALVQLWTIRRTGRLLEFITYYAAGGIVVGIMSALPGLELRIHHYITALVLLPITALPNRISLVFEAFLLGMFLNGAAVWGFDSILQTPEELRRDAPLGSDLPSFNVTSPVEGNEISWNAISDDLSSEWDGFALIINDVLRFAGNATSFNFADFVMDDFPLYFRLAFRSGDTSGDFTQAATLFPGNGTWITPESGPS